MTDYTPIFEMIIAVIIPAVIAYWQKSQKDEAAAFMDPKNTGVTKAPEFIPATAYAMSPETMAEIVAGRSQEETQKILAEIRKAEDDRVKRYTIKTSDGDEYVIEYGYILVRPEEEDLNEELSPMKGDFDPRLHTAEESGFIPEGGFARGLKMPDSRFSNMAAGHSPEEVASMRKQVDEAEAKGLRNYIVKFSNGFYIIENGIVKGGGKG